MLPLRNLSLNLQLVALICGVGLSASVHADVFHYNNIITGDRAMGMGGAYGGVSDDASGVVYNPAGLGFALSNDISGSANAFYRRRVEYKEVIGKDSFVENSEGIFNPFFGGLQKLDHISPGLVLAFGVYSTDAELKDQDTMLKAVVAGNNQIVSYHRTANIRASTNYFGIAAAKRFSSNFSVGAGLNVVKVDELNQIYQDTVFLGTRAKDNGDGTTSEEAFYEIQTQNIREKLAALGIEPVLGMQIVLGGKFSIGLTIKNAVLMSDKLQYNQEALRIRTDNPYTGGNPVVTDPALDPPGNGRIVRVPVDEEVGDILGGWPHEVRLGMAWFANPRFLWTLDVVHRGAVDGSLTRYDREAVLNFASGTEVYLTPSFPLRVGIFTNNDARPEVSSSVAGGEHIDYIGASIFLAWVQPNSQVAIGTVLQQGSGEAQKLGDTNIQKVVAQSTTVGLSASHNF